jgi:NAD dependent epimerase/dehydratase family enzyme
MAEMITTGSRVSCKKIEQTGFSFQFKNLPTALSDLFE